MVDLELVDEWQALVPVVRVLLHDPDFLVLPRHVTEGPGAWIVHDLAQVAAVVVERLLPHDDVPPAGERAQHETAGPRLLQPELDLMRIDDANLRERREQRSAGDHDTLRRPRDARERRVHVLRGEVGAVVELDART